MATRAALLLLAALLWGCDDTPTIKIFPAPPREDLGVGEDLGVAEMGGADMADPRSCAGQLEGERCALNRASGVCVLGRCQLVACEFGWQDCDGRAENGCERDITQPSACGSCARECRAQERCALGERSWVCASGTVCEAGTFDVDRGGDNGCEWRLAAGPETGLLAEADALASGDADGAAWVASSTATARRVGWSNAPLADSGPLLGSDGAPLAVVSPRAIAGRGSAAAVAWGDRATLHAGDADGVMTTGQLTSACGEINGVAWTSDGALLSTINRTVMTVGQQEIASSCATEAGCALEAVTFGPADYLRAFYPYPVQGIFEVPALVADAEWSFGASEAASCAPCLLDVDRGAFVREAACWGGGQCAAQPAQGCEACDAEHAACPTFEPVRVLPMSGGRAVVATERGVVVVERLALGWRPRGRLEAAFDAGAVGGGRVLDAALHERADGSARVLLWHSAGYLRALELRWAADGDAILRPAWADVGLDASTSDARPARVAAWGADRALVIDDRRAWLVGYSTRGATIHAVEATDLASVATLLTARQATDGGVWLTGARFGLLAVWRLVATL